MIRRHAHQWIFARLVNLGWYTGRVYVCAVDGCSRRWYEADPVPRQEASR